MQTKINQIKFLPFFNQKLTIADNKLDYQRSKKKKIIYQKVKGLREAIDEFKLDIDPIQMKKQARKEEMERRRLDKIRIEKELARKKISERLQQFRRSYSNLMIINEMSRNKKYYINEIQKASLPSPIKTNNDDNNNNSGFLLTSNIHNSASMKNISNKEKMLSFASFPFNIRRNQKRKEAKWKGYTQSTNCDIEWDNSGNNSNKKSNKQYQYQQLQHHRGNYSHLSAKDITEVRKEVTALFQSFAIENPFKRSNQSKSQYKCVRGKFKNSYYTGTTNNNDNYNDYTKQQQFKLYHSDKHLGHIATQSQHIENTSEGISWTINCEKDSKPTILRQMSMIKDSKEENAANHMKEERKRMRNSLGTVQDELRKNKSKIFEYSLRYDKLKNG